MKLLLATLSILFSLSGHCGEKIDLKKLRLKYGITNHRISDSCDVLQVKKYIARDDVAMVKEFMQDSCLEGVKDKRGRSFLHWAAETDSMRVADYLMRYGVALNARDNQGKSAWQISKSADMKELIRSHALRIGKKKRELASRTKKIVKKGLLHK